MLIIALVLALIGLTALVAAVVTSNELIAWVCIGASVIGVLLLIADALRARRDGGDVGAGDGAAGEVDAHDQQVVHDYPDEPVTEVVETVPDAETPDAETPDAETPETEPAEDESAEAEPAAPEIPSETAESETGDEAVSDAEQPENDETETAGVTDTDGDTESDDGGAVEISPDPEAPAEGTPTKD